MQRFLFLILLFTASLLFGRTNPADSWNIGISTGVLFIRGEVSNHVEQPMYYMNYQISRPYNKLFWYGFSQEWVYGNSDPSVFIDELSILQTKAYVGPSFQLTRKLYMVVGLGAGLSSLKTELYFMENGSRHYLDSIVSVQVRFPVKVQDVFFVEPYMDFDIFPFLDDTSFYMKTGVSLSF